jgi:hypothetical protein
MRARRLGRLAGLVLALAVAVGAVTGWAGGGFTTMEYEWTGPSFGYDWTVSPLP